MHRTPLLALAAVAVLAGCGQPAEKAAPAAAPGSEPASTGPVNFTIPAGTYKLDPTHAILQWSIKHMGLSDYHARFTNYDASIVLDPANFENSKLTVKIDPRSVSTEYPADYKATHADSPHATWDEELAQSDGFLNAGKFPEITFTSTAIERTGDRTAKVTGDLTFLGVTKPVTLETTLIGQMATHPFTRAGAFGVEAKGQIKPSDFGMKTAPLPDSVDIYFNGEFQAPPAAAAANG